jgi:hypothetical protein
MATTLVNVAELYLLLVLEYFALLWANISVPVNSMNDQCG